MAPINFPIHGFSDIKNIQVVVFRSLSLVHFLLCSSHKGSGLAQHYSAVLYTRSLVNSTSTSDRTVPSSHHLLAQQVPVYYSVAWDSYTISNHSQASIMVLSRKFTSEHKLLRETNVSTLQKSNTLIDIYGGWNSHLYSWNRMIAFCSSLILHNTSKAYEANTGRLADVEYLFAEALHL